MQRPYDGQTRSNPSLLENAFFAQVAEITLELVRLAPLMRLSSGRPEVAIVLIDRPVWMERAELWSANVEVFDQTVRRPAGSDPGCTA